MPVDTYADVITRPTDATGPLAKYWDAALLAFGLDPAGVALEHPVTITLNPDEETATLDCEIRYSVLHDGRIHATSTKPATLIAAALDGAA